MPEYPDLIEDNFDWREATKPYTYGDEIFVEP